MGVRQIETMSPIPHGIAMPCREMDCSTEINEGMHNDFPGAIYVAAIGRRGSDVTH